MNLSRRFPRSSFAAGLLALLTVVTHGVSAKEIPPLRESRVPGGVAWIDLGPSSNPKPTATLESNRVWVLEREGRWNAITGISLATKPGTHELQVTQSGETRALPFVVKSKSYPVQAIKLNRAMVDPPPEVMARIERESAHLKAVRATWRESATTNAAFRLPSEGPLSSRFGVARVLNGKPRSPHAGLDVAAPTGTPVVAPGDAIVLDVGDYYFCGKSIILDHGNGLHTLYCHLSETTAKAGANVTQGERIGAIGSTGRSTGPHLHWTVYLNGTAVEPELFIPAAKR